MVAFESALLQQLGPKFSRLLSDELGLDFRRERWPEMWQGLSSACPELGFTNPEDCLQCLLASPLDRARAEVLASHLTIGETYFLREAQSFKALEEEVLPALIASRGKGGPLRIWSAGCSTGEEAYSVAILIHRYFPEAITSRLSILGTDINSRFLQKASRGVYTEWSFRGTPAWVKENYFVPRANKHFELRRDIRDLVTFGYLNLAQDSFPSTVNGTNGIDLILCRNVLMYFRPELSAQVAEKFYRTLVEDGWLSVSPYDVSHLDSKWFQPSARFGISIHRKSKAVNRRNSSGLSTESRPAPQARREASRPRPFGSPRARSCSRRDTSNELEEAARLLQQGRHSEAVSLLERYLASRPRDLKAIEALVRSLANSGRLEEGLRWCKVGLDLDALNAPLHFLRATILQEQGNASEAIEDLRRVLYLVPDHLLAHFGLAHILHSQRRFSEANRHFQQVLRCLNVVDPQQILPEFEGITAGRLREIVESTIHIEGIQ